MKTFEFAEKIRKEYAKNFPDSFCKVKKYICLGYNLTIECYLSGKMEVDDLPTMANNDMFKITFNIQLPEKFDYDTDELPENLTMECWSNTYLTVPENQYLCYSSRKIPYRKTTGNAEKIIKTAGKFFEKLHGLVLEDISNGKIHKNYAELVAKKVR